MSSRYLRDFWGNRRRCSPRLATTSALSGSYSSPLKIKPATALRQAKTGMPVAEIRRKRPEWRGASKWHSNLGAMGASATKRLRRLVNETPICRSRWPRRTSTRLRISPKWRSQFNLDSPALYPKPPFDWRDPFDHGDPPHPPRAIPPIPPYLGFAPDLHTRLIDPEEHPTAHVKLRGGWWQRNLTVPTDHR